MLFYFAQRLSALSALLFIVTSSTAAAPNDNPSTVKITYQHLNSPSTQPLATITYDPSTLKSTLVSWTPPLLDSLKVSTTEPVSSPLIRVLLPSGSSTLTSLANFNTTLNQTLDLWLSPNGDGSIFSISLSASAPLTLKELKEKARAERHAKRSQKYKKSMKQPQDQPSPKANARVNLIAPVKGPTLKLINRKPPVVGADGQEVPVEEQQEKSFFQKYWWIFLIGAIFAIGGGGGDK